MLLLKGKPVADFIYEQITAQLNQWCTQGIRLPHLAVILVGDDSASQVYVSHKEKACAKLGYKSTLVRLPSQTTEKELTEKIKALNTDIDVDGILLQLPLPAHLDSKKMSDLIAVDKDADGITSHSLGRLVTGQSMVSSCTPSGIIEILKFYKIDIARKNVLLIGRSLIVGQPLFQLLTQQNATVTMAHSKTENIKDLIKNFDYVFVAIGQPLFFKATEFKKDATVIDVGIHRLESGLCGDVDPIGADTHLSALTPVPGGVGPTTIALLMRNTLTLAAKNRNIVL